MMLDYFLRWLQCILKVLSKQDIRFGSNPSCNMNFENAGQVSPPPRMPAGERRAARARGDCHGEEGTAKK